MKLPVYLDYAAATPTDPAVIEVMCSCLRQEGTYANPHAKDHVYGWQAAEVMENAREQVAQLLGVSPLEIYFTSGATESNNLALVGLAQGLRAQGDKRRTIITSPIEHKAILECCENLKSQGYNIIYLQPQKSGIITAQSLKAALNADVFLVTLAQANSVLGCVNDIEEMASLSLKAGAYFHSDIAQSLGLVPLDYAKNQVSMLSITSEKLCGPKGVGALYIKREAQVPLLAQIYGGGQEHGLRGGTVPTHQVAGMGKACEILFNNGVAELKYLTKLREHLLKGLEQIPGAIINGSPEHFVPQIVSVSFEGVKGRDLITSLTDVACSTGSACASADLAPSYILKGIGLSDELALASLRLSFGRFTSIEQLDIALVDLNKTICRLRGR